MMENDSVKQVYSSIYIEESGIQVVCAEFFNTRFNVIFQDRFLCEGIIDFKVLDIEKLSSSIKNALDTASKKIGATIKKVILILPPFQFKKFNINVNVVPNAMVIEKSDIAKALSDSLKFNVSDDLVIVNSFVTKYTINGLTSHKNPVGEKCHDFYISIDLLCCNKELAYNYIKAINKAGYDILDITLNNYSISKESLIIEKSMRYNVVLLDIGRTHTYLTLLKNSSIQSSEIIHSGISNFFQDVYNKYKIEMNSIADLVKYNRFGEDNKDDVIYAWTNNSGANCNITFDEFYSTFKNNLDLYVDNIASMCKPIFDNGETLLVVTGEGADMYNLTDMLKKTLPCQFNIFTPDEIGVRDPSFSAIYGSFQIYKEKADLNSLSVSCVDLYEYNNSVDIKTSSTNSDGLTITTKIKNIFSQYLLKEDKKHE